MRPSLTESGPELDMATATAGDRGQGSASPISWLAICHVARARTNNLRARTHICLLLEQAFLFGDLARALDLRDGWGRDLV
jgi:hypothetical protein